MAVQTVLRGRNASRVSACSVVVSRFFMVMCLLLNSVLFSLSAVSGAEAQVTEVVGTTSAKFGVTPHGEASYSVPIAVPVGTAGLQPQLALQYNSRDRNGILGMGWTVTGLSYITRCASDLYADDPAKGGVGIDGVDYDDKDRFCLNGQRLVPVNGVYGADGTEYRTLFEEFSKIVSYGSVEGGPAYFRVWKQTGEILEYGVTEDSKIRGQSRLAVRNWALSKLSDAKGNYISYKYINDRAAGEFHIDRVDYTGNAAQNLAPYNSIRFVYETRPDAINSYHMGDVISETKRVKSIQVYADSTLAHEYKMAYGSGESKRSRLVSLTECADSATCFKPTQFEWKKDTGSTFEVKDLGEWGGWGAIPGDYNGDGRTDLLMWSDLRNSSEPEYIRFSKGDGTFDVVNAGNINGNSKSLKTGDFNGDGRTDILAHDRISANEEVWLSKGDGTFQVFDIGQIFHKSYGSVVTSDFNGDGFSDILIVLKGSNGENESLWLSNGDGTFRKTLDNEIVGKDHHWLLSDFNGDGLTDIVIINPYGNEYTLFADGKGGFEKVSAGDIIGGGWNFHVGDFNADGIDDIADVKTGGSWESFYVSKSNGTYQKKDAGDIINKALGLHVGDFNGDGLSDLFSERTTNYKYNNQSEYVVFPKIDGGFETLNLGEILYQDGAPTIGDYNGDGLSDFFYHAAKGQERIWQSAFAANPDVITRITNGYGLKTDISYKPLTDKTVYTKGTGAVYPVKDVQSAQYVVASVKSDNGIGSQNEQVYTYAGLRYHVLGLGNLGFEKMTVKDIPTGITTESIYNQDWTKHHQGLLRQSRTIAASGVVMTDKTVTWGVRGVRDANNLAVGCFRFAPLTVTINRDLNGAFLSKVTEEAVYDTYGFPTTVTMTTLNEDGTKPYRKITETTYSHDAANWKLGKATQIKVTAKAPAKTDRISTSAFTYDVDGYVLSETSEPGAPLFHTKTNVRNPFGAITSVTETWGDTANDGITATSRVTSYEYDARMRYKTKETNPLGHVEATEYHAVLGLPTKVTGPNGLSTTMAYDAFGREATETKPDGAKTVTTRSFCGGSVTCAAGGVYKVNSKIDGGVEKTDTFDVLNQEIRSETVIDGKISIVDSTFDALGREIKETAPYFSGETVYNTVTEYDVLGRKVKITRPDTSIQTTSFNGLTQVSTNELGQTRTVKQDELGRNIAVTDAIGNTITYDYDADGHLISMTGDSKVTTYVYDQYGNKVSDSDPDKGTWTYRYNALDKIVEQTNARGEVTRMTYDVLGRMLSRNDNATGANAANRVSTWVYDTAVKGIGKLHKATSTAEVGSGYSVTNSYDALSRPLQSVETVDGENFTTSTSYDAFSRPITLTYPSSLTVNNIYDANGALLKVENTATAKLYWQRLGVDARGNVTKARLGNGVESTKTYQPTTGRLTNIFTAKGVDVVQDLIYTKDFLGNLTRREDKRQALRENFTYDSLNRVTRVDTIRSTPTALTTTVTLTYSTTGNILTKSDVGSYTYGQLHASCGANAFAGPHALTQITGIKNSTYCYDKNGNMVSGDGRSVQYTAYDMPTRIEKGGNVVSFFYGPDRKRYKRIDATVTDGTSTTVYVADKAYERITKGTNIDEKVYIGDFAVMTRTVVGTNSSLKTEYLHRDHLGSVDTITDEAGAVVQRMSFDAFGKRRETNWAAMTNQAVATFDTSRTKRGFTGHEMIDPVGLVHMNGRVYEPEVGRFVSADPIVQDIENLQAYNRYTYVQNNPLTLTDPSGFYAVDGLGVTGGYSASSFMMFNDGAKKVDLNERGQLGLGAQQTRTNTDQFSSELSNFNQALFGQNHIRNATDSTASETGVLRRSQQAGEKVAFARPTIICATCGLMRTDRQTLLKGAHVGLDFLGLVPGAGAIPDLANATLYAFEKNWKEAAMSAVAAIPAIGDAAGAVKVGKNIEKGLEAMKRGTESEARVLKDMGLSKNTEKVTTKEGSSVPDSLNKAMSAEIKDTKIVSFTKQLRIQIEAAQKAGRETVLVTGIRTYITEPVKKAFDRIIRRDDLGPKK